MIDMYSIYNNMYKNGIVYALIYINNHICTSINCMLSVLVGHGMIYDEFVETSNIPLGLCA